MKDKASALYFIALIPDPGLCLQVEQIKKYVREHYHSKQALKSPAHITLQRPFRRSISFEPLLINALSRLAQTINPFTVSLSGYGCFAPRVLFIQALNTSSIVTLHQQLLSILVDLAFDAKELNERLHPHMTIANRDLLVEQFESAWLYFQEQRFEASFIAKSLFLLKHNGTAWDIVYEANFCKK